MRRFLPVVWPVAVLILTLRLVHLPTAPASADLDPSWHATLNYAHAAHLRFGRDIVFSYGPLGHLATGLHIGQPMAGRMVFEYAFVLLNVLGIAACAAHLPWRWAAVFLVLGGLGPTAGNRDVLVNLGFISWGVTCLVAGPRTTVVSALCLGSLVGCASLVKFSWCVTGGLTVAAVACDLIVRRRWLAAALAPATALGSVATLWLASGQPADGFGDFVLSSLEIAAGYPQAMAFPCCLEKLLVGVVALACVAGTVASSVPAADAADRRTHLVRRSVLAGWMATFLFVMWKHGFVRADFGHFLCFYGVVGLMPCALMALPAATPRLAAVRRVCAVVALVVFMGTWRKQPVSRLASAPWRGIANTVRHTLDPRDYQDLVDTSWERAQATLALPRIAATVGDGTIDVFGNAQTYAIANELRYVPRPVFQGYSAYTPRLARRNAEFYRSPRAPAWVLFELVAIDGRLPALEDSRCLLEILHAYRYADESHTFLLLERMPSEPLRHERVDGGTGTVGVPVDLRPHLDNDIWIEIDVHQPPSARLQSLLLRPPGLGIRLDTDHPVDDGAEPPIYNAPAALLSAGFLASPLCVSTADVKSLLRGETPCRTTGFTLEAGPDGTSLVGATFDYRIYRLAPSLRSATPAR